MNLASISSREGLIAELAKAIAQPMEEQAIVEHAHWDVELPLTIRDVNLTFGDEIDLLNVDANGAIVDTSIAYHVCQADTVYTGLSVEVSADPECFVMPGTIGQREVLMSFGTPAWRALIELGLGYDFEMSLNQRSILVRESARSLMHARAWFCRIHEDCVNHPDIGLACLRGGHDVPAEALVRRTLQICQARGGIESLFVPDPNAIKVAKAQPVQLAPMLEGKSIHRFSRPVFVRRGAPLGLRFVQSNAMHANQFRDLLDSTGGRGGSLERIEHVVIPGGAFWIHVSIRGIELNGAATMMLTSSPDLTDLLSITRIA